MGYKLNLTFLLKPASLTSLGLHILLVFYFSQNNLKTIVPSSGVPHIQRVSLKAVPTPTQKPQKEKTTARPVKKKAKATPTPKPIPVEKTAQPTQEVPKKTSQETATKADREHPHFAPTPQYPRLARLRGLEGEVVIQLAVNSKGVPIKTKLVRSSGHPVLDQAALEGLKKWRFEKSTEISQTIAFTTRKTVKFQLQ